MDNPATPALSITQQVTSLKSSLHTLDLRAASLQGQRDSLAVRKSQLQDALCKFMGTPDFTVEQVAQKLHEGRLRIDTELSTITTQVTEIQTRLNNASSAG